MTIFLTVFFAFSEIGHALEYLESGSTIHIGFFGLTMFLALWHGASA